MTGIPDLKWLADVFKAVREAEARWFMVTLLIGGFLVWAWWHFSLPVGYFLAGGCLGIGSSVILAAQGIDAHIRAPRSRQEERRLREAFAQSEREESEAKEKGYHERLQKKISEAPSNERALLAYLRQTGKQSASGRSSNVPARQLVAKGLMAVNLGLADLGQRGHETWMFTVPERTWAELEALMADGRLLRNVSENDIANAWYNFRPNK